MVAGRKRRGLSRAHRTQPRRRREPPDPVVVEGTDLDRHPRPTRLELARQHVEQPRVMVRVRVSDDDRVEHDRRLGPLAQLALELPAEEIGRPLPGRLRRIGDPGVDEDPAVRGRVDEDRVALSDLDEVDLEQALVAQIRLGDQPLGLSRPHPDLPALRGREHADGVAPQQRRVALGLEGGLERPDILDRPLDDGGGFLY